VEGWRRLHNEELSKLYASPNIIRVTKSMMIWMGYVGRMEDMRTAYKILVREPEGKKPLEYLGVDERIILEWILGKSGREVQTGFIWPRTGISSKLL